MEKLTTFRIIEPKLHVSMMFCAQLVEDMRLAREECGACERVSIPSLREQGARPGAMFELIDQGFEMQAARYVLLRRCMVCAATPRYPWAHRLDVERVYAHLNAEGCSGLVCLDSLKALT